MKQVIHIYGASGAGTSTLGRKICDELGFTFMDTDDYFWLPTNPKYTTKREKAERIALIKRDMEAAKQRGKNGKHAKKKEQYHENN